jgi:putative FmdB family regulatory protein
MPLYEYQCQDCGHHFERIERPSELHDGVCPDCGGVAHRLLSAPALQFKGSGWYVTDYGKGNGSVSPDTKPTEESSAAAPSSSESSSSESSKPKPTTPSKTDTKVA